MGGPGSGRWPGYRYFSLVPSKQTTEDYFNLDIRELKRFGLIDPGQQELPGIAKIVWIPAGFGLPHALRPWFLCPREDCGKRVAILYERSSVIQSETGAPSWACRTCRNLCYKVENETPGDRAARRMRRIEAHVGPEGEKPPRMSNETYHALATKYREAHDEHVGALHKLGERLVAALVRERIESDL